MPAGGTQPSGGRHRNLQENGPSKAVIPRARLSAKRRWESGSGRPARRAPRYGVRFASATRRPPRACPTRTLPSGGTRSVGSMPRSNCRLMSNDSTPTGHRVANRRGGDATRRSPPVRCIEMTGHAAVRRQARRSVPLHPPEKNCTPIETFSRKALTRTGLFASASTSRGRLWIPPHG